MVALELCAALVLAVVLATALTGLSGRPLVADDSMQPAVPEGTRLWVKDAHKLARGDLVVVEPHPQWAGARKDSSSRLNRAMRSLRLASPAQGTRMLTRIVGVPGDEVRCCADGRVLVNGAATPAPPTGGNFFRVVVPEGFYFVSTDAPGGASSQCYLHRLGSGALVPRERVVGKSYSAGWPWARVDLARGAAPYTGIAPGSTPPRDPIIESAKDPAC